MHVTESGNVKQMFGIFSGFADAFLDVGTSHYDRLIYLNCPADLEVLIYSDIWRATGD